MILSLTQAEALFQALKHGDADHDRWLKEAIVAWSCGHPVPGVQGLGNKEARIDRLEKQLVESVTREYDRDKAECDRFVRNAVRKPYGLFWRNFARSFGSASGWFVGIAAWIWVWRLMGVIPFHLIDSAPK